MVVGLVSTLPSTVVGVGKAGASGGPGPGLLVSSPLGVRQVSAPTISYPRSGLQYARPSSGTKAGVSPQLSCPWPPSSESPPSYLTSPSDGAVIATTTPLLSAYSWLDPGSPTYDGGCYPIAYDFKVMTSPGGGETVADSTWLYYSQSPSQITNWTVPQGALRDGETYWVSVQTDDTELLETPLPAITTSFTVKLRKGAGGPSPTDTVGASPSGTSTPSQGAPNPGLTPASETVNLLTGDLALTAGTRSLQSVSGTAAVSLSYNSLDADVYGLNAQYFVDPGDHTFSRSDTLIGQKVDPMIDFSWGCPIPGRFRSARRAGW